jgi:hypothetical protein
MQTRDNVAAELQELLKDSRAKEGRPVIFIDQDVLMMKLCSFVARRDSRVWNDAYKKGRDDQKKEEDVRHA